MSCGEVFHDFFRAAADHEHFRFAIDALGARAAHEAGTAQYLHRFARAELHRLTGEVFRHRELRNEPGIARSLFDPLAEAGVNVDMIVQNVGHDGATDISFTVPRVELARAEKVLGPVVEAMDARGIATDPTVAKVSIVGAGLHNAPGYAARMFGTLADAGVNIEMISTSEVRITCMIAEADLETALRALHDAFELERPETIEAAAAG